MLGGVMERYGDYLPMTPRTPIVTMGEGSTPLVRSRVIGPELGCENLYFKLEGSNPTGSFKDRGMCLAVARALEDGARHIICASTGNTSASAAAYGARYGLSTIVVVPAGEIAIGKLAQAMAYGARIFAVNGNFDDALNLVREAADRLELALVNSVNPYRIEGQKTGAFEIVDDLGDVPDFLCIPVGNAGNITAYWRGFNEYKDKSDGRLPRMMGFQAAGAAPIVDGAPVSKPRTIASAIRIGNPASWRLAEEARDESDGMIEAVTDDQIIDAYLRLSRQEGIFCEPASAASVAGVLRLPSLGVSLAGRTVVCILTGNGLKDPSTAEQRASVELEYVEPKFAQFEAALKGDL
ncbi:MAG: threonine synthase [Chloroflexi bacterium]|nr:threonine synthase [Chloroflexota bacterium]MCH8818172.1 threonine synthase [Chloroflexota bacterium]